VAKVSGSEKSLTGLLQAWGKGDLDARDPLLPIVYDELRRQAAHYLRRERAGHTLQPTALVHEVYLRLAGPRRVPWRSRAEFFAAGAQAMRRILVDHARKRASAKRAGDWTRVTVESGVADGGKLELDLLALDEALDRLSELDPRHGRIVELRLLWRPLGPGDGLRAGRLADGTLVPFQVPLPPWIPAGDVDVGRCRWLPDGRAIAFIGQEPGGTYAVYVQELAVAGGRTPRPRSWLPTRTSRWSPSAFRPMGLS
jgi:RNA polymerase sigma-70 factor (ECF subfamily)